MSGEEDLNGRVTRECVAILDASGYGGLGITRDVVLNYMARAYLAGRASAIEEWGKSLDRMHGALAEQAE